LPGSCLEAGVDLYMLQSVYSLYGIHPTTLTMLFGQRVLSDFNVRKQTHRLPAAESLL